MNWLAVAVSVVSVFVLSSVYYSVVGHQAGDGSRPAPWQILAELCRGALVTITLAVLIGRMDLGFGGALVLALAAWVAFPFVLLVARSCGIGCRGASRRRTAATGCSNCS